MNNFKINIADNYNNLFNIKEPYSGNNISDNILFIFNITFFI